MLNKKKVEPCSVYFQARQYGKCNRIPHTKTIEYPIDKASADLMMRSILGLIQYKIVLETEKRKSIRRLLKLSVAFANLYTLYKEKGLDSEKITTEPKG